MVILTNRIHFWLVPVIASSFGWFSLWPLIGSKFGQSVAVKGEHPLFPEIFYGPELPWL
jgi:hypothetical protein